MSGDQSAAAFFFSWGREGVSPKGDSGRCVAGLPDSLLFVERTWDVTPRVSPKGLF